MAKRSKSTILVLNERELELVREGVFRVMCLTHGDLDAVREIRALAAKVGATWPSDGRPVVAWDEQGLVK